MSRNNYIDEQKLSLSRKKLCENDSDYPCARCPKMAICFTPCLEWQSWFRKRWRDNCDYIYEQGMKQREKAKKREKFKKGLL